MSRPLRGVALPPHAQGPPSAMGYARLMDKSALDAVLWKALDTDEFKVTNPPATDNDLVLGSQVADVRSDYASA